MAERQKLQSSEKRINGSDIAIGLNQIHALPENLPDLFADMNSLRETSLDRMFLQRLDVLKRCL